MKPGSILFLKAVILLIATAALIGLIVLPQLEGRAVNLDLVSIYSDPFIIYGYLASIPFFIALYQAFKLLNLIDQNKTFSQASVQAFRTIKMCAIAIVGFIIGSVLFIVFTSEEDFAGFVALGIYTSFISIIVATFAAVLQKIVQNGMDIKSENDLIV